MSVGSAQIPISQMSFLHLLLECTELMTPTEPEGVISLG